MIENQKLVEIMADISAVKMTLKDATDKLTILLAKNMGVEVDVIGEIIEDMNKVRGIK